MRAEPTERRDDDLLSGSPVCRMCRRQNSNTAAPFERSRRLDVPGIRRASQEDAGTPQATTLQANSSERIRELVG
jgi:hypothetical protein